MEVRRAGSPGCPPSSTCYLLGSPYPFKNVLSLAADLHWNYVMVDHGWTGPSSCTGDIPGTGLARCDTDHRARAGSPSPPCSLLIQWLPPDFSIAGPCSGAGTIVDGKSALRDMWCVSIC